MLFFLTIILIQLADHACPCLINGESNCINNIYNVCYNGTWIPRACPPNYSCYNGICSSNVNNDFQTISSAFATKEDSVLLSVVDSSTTITDEVDVENGIITVNVSSGRSYFRNNWMLKFILDDSVVGSVVTVPGLDFLEYFEPSALDNTINNRILLVKSRKWVEQGVICTNDSLLFSIKFTNITLASKKFYRLIFSGENFMDGVRSNLTDSAAVVGVAVMSAVQKSQRKLCELSLFDFDGNNDFNYKIQLKIVGTDNRKRSDQSLKFEIPFGQEVVSSQYGHSESGLDVIVKLGETDQQTVLEMKRVKNLILPEDIRLIDQTLIDLAGRPIEIPIPSVIKY